MNDPYDPAQNQPNPDDDCAHDDAFDGWCEHLEASDDEDWLDSLKPLEPDDAAYDEDDWEPDPGHAPAPSESVWRSDDAVAVRFWELMAREMGAQFTGLPVPVEPAAFPYSTPTNSITGRSASWAIGEAVDNTMNALFGPTHPERLTFDQMVQVAADVWELDEVCDLFVDHLRSVSTELTGGVHDTYATPVAVTIIRAFTETWHGCPDQDWN